MAELTGTTPGGRELAREVWKARQVRKDLGRTLTFFFNIPTYFVNSKSSFISLLYTSYIRDNGAHKRGLRSFVLALVILVVLYGGGFRSSVICFS